jgi:hypothetical protein
MFFLTLGTFSNGCGGLGHLLGSRHKSGYLYIYIETHRRRKKQTDRSSLREPGGRKRQEEWMYAFVGTSTYIRFREFLLFRLVGASSAFLSSFLSNH